MGKYRTGFRETKMHHLEKRLEGGASLFELLLGITLFALVSFLILNELARGSKIHAKLTQHYERSINESHIKALVQRGLLEQSSQRFFYPKIHTSGHIKLLSGKRLPISAAQSPQNQSDAISFLKVRPDTIFKVTQTNPLTACVLSGASLQLAQYQSFLIVSSDGVSEAVGKARGSGPCRSFSLRLADGVFTEAKTVGDLSFARTIIPVERIYTLYMSRRGELRYVGHVGSKVIENQPVLKSTAPIKFELLHLNPHQPSELHATLTQGSRSRVLRWPFFTALTLHSDYAFSL
jgi:hypothetical protein